MQVMIVPEPTEPERQAIVAALAVVDDRPTAPWAEAALAEAVEGTDPEP